MTTQPNFFIDRPIEKQRLYNGRKLMVWEGKIKISSISGWVDNPRIELAKKKLKHLLGDRQLTQEEIADLMKNDPEVRLKELRDDILKNGLREPLTLSHSGKLLDGNRRFFAIKYALESFDITDPNRQDLETIDAFVLSKVASEEDEQNVLVEENFSPSLKIEWPDYVKALRVVEASENGLTPDQISKKFSWPKSKIKDTLKIQEIITEFISFATAPCDPEDESGGGLGLTEQEAETIAAKNYQYFNEAKKSFFDALKTDFEFKIQFFKWIKEGKFSGFAEVRIAYSAWKSPEAKSALMQSDPTAAKSAKAILDYNSRIVRGVDETIGRIENFLRFLNEMTTEEVKLLPISSRNKLESALGLVIKMSKAAAD